MVELVAQWVTFGVFIVLGLWALTYVCLFRPVRTREELVQSLFMVVLIVLFILGVGAVGWGTLTGTASSCLL